jgi:hypothetical protein
MKTMDQIGITPRAAMRGYSSWPVSGEEFDEIRIVHRPNPRNSTMKALIIYDDVTRAANTNAVLHRVAHRADMAVKWDIRPWRLNMLKLPATAGLALRDAVDAHLIVFAIRRINKLHVWLMNWLEQWATLRQTPDAALALVGDGTAKASMAPATVAMSRFARQNGLSFFFNNHGEINNKPAFSDPSPNEEISYVLAPSPPVRPAPNSSAHLAWGIND